MITLGYYGSSCWEDGWIVPHIGWIEPHSKECGCKSTQMYKILSVYGVAVFAVLLIIHFLKTLDGIFLSRAYALTNDEGVETHALELCISEVQCTISSN